MLKAKHLREWALVLCRLLPAPAPAPVPDGALPRPAPVIRALLLQWERQATALLGARWHQKFRAA